MKTKITQNLLFLGIFLISTMSFAQALPVGSPTYYLVEDVFPTRVTTGTEITVIGGSGFTNSTVVSISDIATGTEVPGNVGTQLSFPITTTGNSQTDKLLKIDNLPVYRNSFHTDSLVKISYVKPSSRSYSEDRNYGVTEIFTDWDYNGNGYYRSSWYSYSNKATWPDASHDLLAYTITLDSSSSFPGTYTYSTGVNDALLDTIDGLIYIAQDYKAYSTNGITGTPHSSNYLAMADLIDGHEDLRKLNDNVRATVYDVLIDGKNGQGLDLGTGITNFNKEASIRFFSGNGAVGAVGDGVPDLLLTQIADPGGSDIYYYADIDGNVLGHPLKLSISNSAPKLYQWYLDLYRMDLSVPYDLSLPVVESFNNNDDRPFRMIAFELDEFGIDSTNIGEINNINMLAGGSADIAFMAYNKAAFDIKSPTIVQFPVSRNVCKVPNSTGVTFNTEADIDGGGTGATGEALEYQWYRNFAKIPGATSNTYTLPSVTLADLITYKVRVYNDFGAIDLPVSLSEGGTPTYWNGSSWELPAALSAAGVTVSGADRNLIFSENYAENINLEGCDCRVPAGKTVTIPAGKTLKLYSTITVESEIAEVLDVDDNVVIPYTPAGTFTLENNASLIQIKPVTSNENSGSINVKRIASDIQTYDYIYWSSPVVDFKLSNIPGSAGYSWNVGYDNTNGSYGNWASVSSGMTMTVGSGYIKRVPSSLDFTTTFTGKPNNGNVSLDVYKTPSSGDNVAANRHWNLVGNPYPSSINANDFLDVNTNIKGAVYLWKHDAAPAGSISDPFYGGSPLNYSDQYLTYNGVGSTPDTGYDGNIASGQGFFVQVLDGSPETSSLSYTNEMRYDGSEEAYGNSQFYRTSETNTSEAEVQKELVWLNLVNEANSSSVALVGYVDGATNGADRMYDAIFNGEGMSMYSVLDDSKMVIQGRSFPFEETDTVQLGIDIPANGIYRIGIEQLKGDVFLTNGQAIYLEDTYTNVIHDLRDSPYSFAGVVGSTIDRFVLRYTASQLSVEGYESNSTFVYLKDQQFYLKSTKNIKSIDLYDVTGKQLPAYKVSANSNTFNAPFQYPRGVYIAVIKLDDNVVITKKLIN
ncbi:T9SS type A sorting domain-containing protein [Bizionia arctica]|uniref:T9SS type A sorting domain-containing protein n=1 Tax=Bizionia arctica TaxID=1495645 RepID=A0A917LLI6_9FLAO|nr:T9SS type A sorting domain-containing protein [Bizionia arctica]GGG41225.1 hypothetical protein GCM10010976_11030 [Bizionia arctica]